MRLSDKKTEYYILLLILLMGLFIRLYNYASFSLSNDELSAINRCNYHSFHDLFVQGVGIDFHPAGVQTFLYYWIKVFGNSEVSVRFPFVIFGTLAILFAYLFSRRWFGATPALFSAAAIAFLEFPIVYSQIARPYSSGLMLSLLLAYLWSIVLFPKEKEKKHIWLYAALLGVALALNLYNHYFSGLLAFIIGVSAIVMLNKNNLKPYLLALLLGSILFLPHIPMTLHHMSKGGLSSWLGAPDWWWPIEHIQNIFISFYLLGFLVMIILFLRIKNREPYLHSKTRILLFLYFLLPLAIGFFYSIYVNPVIQNSVLIFSMPFLIIWLFSFLPKELNKNSIIALLILSISMIGNNHYHKQKVLDLQNFKGIAEQLMQFDKNNQAQSKLWLMDSNSPNYIQYYLKNEPSKIRFAQWKIKDEQDLLMLKNILDTTSAELLSYVLLGNYNNTAYYMMANKFPFQAQTAIYYADNAQIFFFSKKPNRQSHYLLNAPPHFIAKYESKDSIINMHNQMYSQGLEYHFNNKNLENPPMEYGLSVKMKIKAAQLPTQSHIVCSIIYENIDNTYWKSAPLRYFLHSSEEQNFFFKMDLPTIEQNATLKVYLWNPEKEHIELRDIEISLFDKKG